MAAYIALARKWRSKQFADIVGQTAVVKTLMNSIQKDRVHHAYLFTGSRGIGKTSIARIFAKSLRCENSLWNNGWLTTCDECSDCLEIQAGQSVNVLEIDGASNNGVDAVRELRENSRFLPSSGKRKIYIIDEVHMLTTAAFNALLKILEEPPEHVLFILATTEPHKIPSTVLSRVQKFDLKRMTPEQIEHHLGEITKAEGITAEPAALSLLARAAEGSMRDSLSLFDQVIAYSQGHVTADSVRESTGLVQGEVVFETISAIFKKDPKSALLPLASAYQKGIEMKALCRAILDALYVTMLLKLETPLDQLKGELPEAELKQYQEILPFRSLEEIELFFQVFHHGFEALGRSPTPRLWLEVLILKCAAADALVPVRSPHPTTPSPTDPSPSRRSPLSPNGTSNTSSPASSSGEKKSLLFGNRPPPGSLKNALADANSLKPAETYQGPRDWETFVQFVRGRRPLLGAVLEHASCDQFPLNEGEDFLICFSEKEAGYYREQMQTRLYQEELLSLTKDFFGRSIRIQTEMRATVLSLAEKKERQRAEWETTVRTRAASHPVLMEARTLFGAEMGPIELLYPNEKVNSSSAMSPIKQNSGGSHS
jgi:DNA polymerase III subunit gamma/tau